MNARIYFLPKCMLRWVVAVAREQDRPVCRDADGRCCIADREENLFVLHEPRRYTNDASINAVVEDMARTDASQ